MGFLVMLLMFEDWTKTRSKINYFAHFSIRNQKIDSTLVISNEEFTEYWPQSLSVQDLSTNKAVLCHGIANLLNEFSIALSYSNALNEYLLETSQKLRFLEEDDANFVLSEVINDLKNKKKSLVAINTEGTPIPSISFNAKEKHVEEGFNNTNAISLNSQINIAKKKNLRDIQSKITNQSYRTLSEIALEIPIWALIFLNGWWINLIIEVAKIRLSDNLIIALVISFFIFTILFFTSFFINPQKNIFFRMSALLIICLTELMTILSFISIISPHLWLWIPSATILSAASFFLIFKIIQNIKKLSS
jgi:hypothetical protein